MPAVGTCSMAASGSATYRARCSGAYSRAKPVASSSERVSTILHRDYQPARPELEVQQLPHLPAALRDQVRPRHPDFRRAVRNEFRDVRGPEEDGPIAVPERCHQRTVASHAGLKSGLAEQRQGALRKAALVGQRDSQRRQFDLSLPRSLPGLGKTSGCKKMARPVRASRSASVLVFRAVFRRAAHLSLVAGCASDGDAEIAPECSWTRS